MAEREVHLGEIAVVVVAEGVGAVIQKDLLERQRLWLQRLCMTGNYLSYLPC